MDCRIAIAQINPRLGDLHANHEMHAESIAAAKAGGADGISAINTVAAMVGIGLDDYTPRPNVAGVGAASGYSGPAIKPIGLRCVAQMAGNPR